MTETRRFVISDRQSAQPPPDDHFDHEFPSNPSKNTPALSSDQVGEVYKPEEVLTEPRSGLTVGLLVFSRGPERPPPAAIIGCTMGAHSSTRRASFDANGEGEWSLYMYITGDYSQIICREGVVVTWSPDSGRGVREEAVSVRSRPPGHPGVRPGEAGWGPPRGPRVTGRFFIFFIFFFINSKDLKKKKKEMALPALAI